jgi:hypothetical protein
MGEEIDFSDECWKWAEPYEIDPDADSNADSVPSLSHDEENVDDSSEACRSTPASECTADEQDAPSKALV